MRKQNIATIVICAGVVAGLATVFPIQKVDMNKTQNGRVGNNLAIYPDVPGAINPDVTQDNIKDTICKKGWTDTIRPPTIYTNKLKLEQLSDEDDKHMGTFEEDHEISLQLGGHATSTKNLWPQPYIIYSNGIRAGAREKDVAETALKREVCNGTITLQRAQEIITQDWFACYLDIKDKKLCL